MVAVVCDRAVSARARKVPRQLARAIIQNGDGPVPVSLYVIDRQSSIYRQLSGDCCKSTVLPVACFRAGCNTRRIDTFRLLLPVVSFSLRSSSISAQDTRRRIIVSTTMSVTSLTIDTRVYDGQKPGTSGLRKSVKIFQQEHYTENFVQAILQAMGDQLAGCSLVVGGDGRFYCKEAIMKIIRIAAANGVRVDSHRELFPSTWFTRD